MGKITKIMNNEEIYRIAMGFYKNFNGDLIFPIKVNFYLSKNKNYFLNLGKQIEEFKDQICEKYDKQTQLEQINRELKDLSVLQQEVTFYQVSLEDFGDINLSMEQLETIEFMIKEE